MRLLLTAVSFCIAMSISSAQDTLTLTFQDALRMALERNVPLRQQDNLVAVTRAGRLRGLAAYLPDLNISSSARRISGRQQNDSGRVVLASSSMGFTLASGYTLFNGFGRLNALMQSSSAHEAQLSQVEQARQNTIFSVGTQYLQVLLDEELVKITRESIAAQRVSLGRLKGFVEADITSASDQYTLEAQISLAEVQLLTRRNQLFSDRATLAATLMLDPGAPYRLTVPGWGIEGVLTESLDLSALWETAKSSRPDLRQLEQSSRASYYGLRVARSAIYPSLGLFYNYSNSFTSLSHAPFGGGGLSSNNPLSVIGLSLTIPVFNRFQYRAGIVSARVSYENGLLGYEGYKNIVYAQVATAYNNLLTNRETYRANVAGCMAARLSFEKQDERFRLGVGTVVELSLASQNYLQALSGRAQAEYSLLFQKVIIDYYTGVLSGVDLSYDTAK